MDEWRNEQDFDDLMQDMIPELPPDDVAYTVTPWRKAINRVLTGFALGAVTLNFLGLNYLLPTIGVVLTLLGFRTLRRENKYFSACWVLAVAHCALYFPSLMLNSTIYQQSFQQSTASFLLNTLNVGSMFALYFCFWNALRTVQKKAGLEPHAGSVIGLIIWNGLIVALSLMQMPGNWLFGAIFIISYICIIRRLVKLSAELDEAGYCITPAPVRMTDRWVAVILSVVLLTGCGCGYLFFSQYSMDWQEMSHSDTAEVQQVKTHLKKLGFPAHILEDLTEADILACKDAVRVEVNVQDHAVNDGREVMERDGNRLHIYTVYDTKELRLTGIGVELPGGRDEWKVFHHFQWVHQPDYWGTEAIQLWPAHRSGNGWLARGEYSGQVLYDDGATRYAAPFHALGTETYTAHSIFWGDRVTTDVFATFSMPRGGQNQRGYVSYGVMAAQEGWLMDAWINYTHQTTWLQYPVLTAKENQIVSAFGSNKAFKTVQDALQFYPWP